MTTIAYRDGILAADTMGNWGGTPTRVSKILKGRGFVMAGSGAWWRILALFNAAQKLAKASPHERCSPGGMWRHLAENLRDPNFNPSNDDGPAVLLIQPITGNVVWLAGPIFIPVEFLGTEAQGFFVAIGSGAGYALGAMAAGATAEEAVHIACQLDVNTGGAVESLNVKEITP